MGGEEWKEDSSLSLSLLRTIGLPNLEDYLIKYLFEGFTDLEIRTGE